LKPASGQTGFAIASDDRTFHPAQARVDGDTIVLSHPSVSTPTHVRYLWSNNPPVTLFNRDGLPAPPFRTDAWETFIVAPSRK
jgi:sialate O-acetylesterase